MTKICLRIHCKNSKTSNIWRYAPACGFVQRNRGCMCPPMQVSVTAFAWWRLKNRKAGVPECAHCKKKGKHNFKGHMEDTCWDLHPELCPSCDHCGKKGHTRRSCNKRRKERREMKSSGGGGGAAGSVSVLIVDSKRLAKRNCSFRWTD